MILVIAVLDPSDVEPVQLTDMVEEVSFFPSGIPSDFLLIRPFQGLGRSRGEAARRVVRGCGCG